MQKELDTGKKDMLQEELIPPGQEPPGLEQEIIDTIGSFAVAMFGIDRREKRENVSTFGVPAPW